MLKGECLTIYGDEKGMRLTQKTLTLNEPTKRFLFGISLSEPWSQVFSGVACGLFFFIFGVMLIYALEHAAEGPALAPKDPTARQRLAGGRMSPPDRCYSDASCSLACDDIEPNDDVTDIVEYGYEEMNGASCRGGIELSLLSSNFKDSVLKPYFLNVSFNIKKIQFKDSLILDVEPGAFLASCFHSLNSLIMVNINFDHLKENAFVGLGELKEFVLRSGVIRRVDPGVVLPFYRTVEIFQIQSIENLFDPTNFTGVHPLASAVTVDLRFNNIEEITYKTFLGLIACTQLFLTDCKILYIHNNAFVGMRRKQLIDINDNLLTTLPSDILGKVGDVFTINLKGNSWNCDCRFKWIKEFDKNKHVGGFPVCSEPPESSGKNFSSAEFCKEEITIAPTETESPTTTPSTVWTTFIPDLTSPFTETTVSLICDTSDYYNEDGALYYRRRLLGESTQLTKQTIHFAINDADTGVVSVEIKAPLREKSYLIWFSDTMVRMDAMARSSLIGCMAVSPKSVMVENLDVGESYSFCVINESDMKISPFNCRAHVIPQPWTMQTWLSNKDKTLVTGIIGICLIFCLLMGAAIVYLMIRRNPSLLRGSKRVVMVKHRAAEAIVMPPNFKEEDYLSDERKPPKRTHSRRGNFRRSVSETSVLSGRSMDASYVSAVEPTAFQLLHWKLERLRGEGGAKDPGVPTHPPPPLPPLLPKRPVSPMLSYEYDNISCISDMPMS